MHGPVIDDENGSYAVARLYWEIFGEISVDSAIFVSYRGREGNNWLFVSFSLGELMSRLVSISSRAAWALFFISLLFFIVALTPSFVDLTPCCCLRIWPLSVAGDASGRCCSTAMAVRPGHVVSWLFLMVFNKVALVGENRY